MKRLKITYLGTEIVSDIFNMKAFRVMQGAMSFATSLDNVAMQGLIAMFDGTALTSDALMSGQLDEKEIEAALSSVTDWYYSIKTPEAGPMVGEMPENPVLGLYNSLLPHHLPCELDKQDPQLLFDVIHAAKSSAVPADEIPDDVKELYGL